MRIARISGRASGDCGVGCVEDRPFGDPSNFLSLLFLARKLNDADEDEDDEDDGVEAPA